MWKEPRAAVRDLIRSDVGRPNNQASNLDFIRARFSATFWIYRRCTWLILPSAYCSPSEQVRTIHPFIHPPTTMSAPARTPMGAKKPIPAAVKPQQKKPIPAAVRPQTNAKKPIPAAVRPQTRPAASKPPPTNNIATKTGSVTPRAPASNAVSRAPAANKPSAPSAGGQGAAQAPSMGNWINRTVQNSVAGVGNYAGGFVNSIADSVNKVGDGVGAS